jgi:hypothetical protein
MYDCSVRYRSPNEATIMADPPDMVAAIQNYLKEENLNIMIIIKKYKYLI